MKVGIKQYFLSRQFFYNKKLLVLSFGIVGFVAPMIYGFINGFPVPHAHDELAYTVAADTYASGRVTNPTPAYFEHFETPHVLMEPSYISKYPPMQGLLMAAGQVLFGRQIFGVWLSCGIMAAALFWMLSAWTKPQWAVFGTVLMILFIGINSYWAQSYWGGMAAASGGALFFGGFRRLFKKLAVGSTILMTLGGVILVNSRPFEGTLTMLPCLLVLLAWLLRDKKNSPAKKLSQVILPGIIIAAIALSAMGYQYYRVTGSAFTMPYSVHHSQYYPTPLFIFESVNKSATRGNARIRKIYDRYTSPTVLLSYFDVKGLPDPIYLNFVYGMIYLITAIPSFFLSPILAIFLCGSLIPIIRRSKWLLLIAATVIFTFACMTLGIWWDQYHYAASLSSCFFLLMVEGFRQFHDSSQKGAQRHIVLIMLFGLAAGSFVYMQIFLSQPPVMKDDFSIERTMISEHLSSGEPISIEIPGRATFFKSEFEDIIEKLPNRYIAIVTYDANFNFHDEIIYNKADIANAKLIWAHDLGDEKNESLLEYYNNRNILMIKISDSQIEIKQLPPK